MVPAWQEADVLFGAVANLIKTIDYENYHLFIGVYPNDEQTRCEADRLSRQFRRVHTVVTQLPGPTCKADCLNEIIKAIFTYEQRRQLTFSGVIMQDAEDVIHPLSMKLFNYYLPEHDLVQIPVYSLKRKWWQLTGGHYMDEFAEFHSKEILVRQSFANVVPGAGVGTAMSKKALEFARQQSGEYYNTNSLTEDYEFSFRTQGSELKQVFARIKVPGEINKRYKKRADVDGDKTGSFIATREFFPNRFWWSVRQKTRWTIGISFQAWASMGWKGNWRLKYLFWRDRKMLFFSHAIAMGFLSIAVFLGYKIYLNLIPGSYHLAPLLSNDSWLWNVVYFNLTVLAFRILQRMAWSAVYYGWSVAPMVVPRYVWAAVINYLAIVRATKSYLGHLVTGRSIGWDKTSHDFLEMDEIDDMKRPLGDLLVKRGFLNQPELDRAIKIQSETGQLLGRILFAEGWVQECDLMQVLSEKYQLPLKPLDPFVIPLDVITLIPYEQQRSRRIIPCSLKDRSLTIASCRILESDEIEQLETDTGYRVDVQLTSTRDINFALHVIHELNHGQPGKDPVLVKIMQDIQKELSEPEFTDVAQRATASRDKYRSLGEQLVKQGLIDLATLEKYLHLYLLQPKPLGTFLIEQGEINQAQLDNALVDVSNSFSDVINQYRVYADEIAEASAAKKKIA